MLRYVCFSHSIDRMFVGASIFICIVFMELMGFAGCSLSVACVSYADRHHICFHHYAIGAISCFLVTPEWITCLPNARVFRRAV